jgi:hypothetical protein
MTYTITVKNSGGAPVDAAYVNFIASGVVTETLATGADGTITIDTVDDADLFTPGTTMQVTAAGYPAFSIPTTSITGNSVVTLGAASGGGNSNLGIIAVVVAAGAYLLFYSGGAKVSGEGGSDSGGSKTDYSKYILPAGIVLLAYGIYKSIFGPGAGTAATAANTAAIVTADNTANAQTLQQVLSVESPTLTASQIASMSNTIFSLGMSGNPVSQANQDAIQDQVINVNNNADWYSLVSSFGVKSVSSASALTAALSLPGSAVDTHSDSLQTFLVGVLDQAHIDDINNFFSGAGINQSL